MTQHTSRLCKGYLTKKKSDGVLRQMTWPSQSTNLNPIEIVWDEPLTSPVPGYAHLDMNGMELLG
jgi:hypothetical protein